MSPPRPPPLPCTPFDPAALSQHVRSYLWKNPVGDEGTASIATAVENHPTIEVVYLGYSAITDVGAAVLAQKLRHNNVLRTLDLRGNTIGEDGAEAIAGALYHNTALKKIHLFNNNIGTEGAKHIERALSQNKNLHTLNVHDNDISDKQHASIARQLVRNQQTTPQQPRLQQTTVTAALSINASGKIDTEDVHDGGMHTNKVITVDQKAGRWLQQAIGWFGY